MVLSDLRAFPSMLLMMMMIISSAMPLPFSTFVRSLGSTVHVLVFAKYHRSLHMYITASSWRGVPCALSPDSRAAADARCEMRDGRSGGCGH